jgi:hypothetical protein
MTKEAKEAVKFAPDHHCMFIIEKAAADDAKSCENYL